MGIVTFSRSNAGLHHVDGYGRYRPCSAGYKAANPNWRAGDSCFTDDGYGRYRPCSAGYKAKHAK